jgi:two-component system sensor histidine kinase UhpB
MFEFVPIGFFTFGPAGRILEVNPTGARLLGADRSDLLDKKFTRFIAERFQAGFRHHCEKVFESGNRESYDLQLFSAKRSFFWAQLESIAVDAGNSLNGRKFNTAITDITDRKQAEDALCTALEKSNRQAKEVTALLESSRAVLEYREFSEERFRSVVETAIDAIVTVDHNGRIIFWNQKAESMFGYKSAEVIGRPVALIMPERFRQAHQRGLNRAASNKNSKIAGNILELVGLRKDADEFPLELSLANWETKEGIFFTAIIRDISERKQSEKELQAVRDELERRVDLRTAELGETNIQLRKQVAECEQAQFALKESELKYATLVEDALIGVYILQDGKIEFANEKFADIYGYSKDELLGMDSLDLVHPEDRPLVKKLREKRLRGEKVPAEYESKGLKKNGDIIWVMRSFSQITYKGRPAISGIVADISKRRRAEEALRKSDKELRVLSNQLLSAEEKERKRIARELHDGIGQALSAIKFSVENAILELRSAANPVDPGSLEAVIPLAQKTIEEVRRIVKDLRPSILDDLGILATIRWFCREFQNVYAGIRIETSIGVEENDVSPHLKTTIYRIMQEALNNVAKHSRANFVQLQLIISESHLNLSIRDNGRGFNLDKAMALKTSRRGFGLASMRERAELSGASFEINSAGDTGTMITVVWAN